MIIPYLTSRQISDRPLSISAVMSSCLVVFIVADNGGMASFAQFADAATNGGTFDNMADFDDHVDNVPRTLGGRAEANISGGLAKGRELLNAFSSTASFLILVTDGEWNSRGDPKVCTAVPCVAAFVTEVIELCCSFIGQCSCSFIG